MKIYTDTPEGVTVVKNTFIDQYMPQANGEFVKVYLYLLRCANTGRELSLSSIADVLEHTENDVRRALLYWEKQDLIHMKANQRGDLQSITFSDLPSAADEPESQSSLAAAASPKRQEQTRTEMTPGAARMADRMAEYTERAAGKGGRGSAVPLAETAGEDAGPAAALSRERLKALSEQKEIRQLFFIAEQYLQRPLTSSEQSEFVYYYDSLHFSVDLIEYLIEYCISKGTFSRHYMRKVALAWAEAGISTVLQAKQETNLYNKNYYTILNTFGIKGRSPAQPEIEFMARWLNEYGFTLDLIIEACSRTIRQIHQPSFEYADKILRRWKNSGVTSAADVRRLDQQRSEEQQRRSEKKQQAEAPKRAANNRFNNFSQRDYDYSELERQLLGN